MTKIAALVVAMAAFGATARADQFEFINYTPPPGWTRLAAASGVAYALGDDGLLSIRPSRPARGDAATEFAAMWRELVEPGGGTPPAPSVRGGIPGELASGVKQVRIDGRMSWVYLTVIVGNGRTLAIVTAGRSEGALRTLGAVFQTMTFSAPAPTGSIDVDFDVPPGYARQDDGANVMFVPLRDPKVYRVCTYWLAPSRPSSGDLAADARAAADQTFGKYRDLGFAERGQSSTGWSYHRIRFDGMRTLPDGRSEDYNGMAMAYAAVDGRVHIAFAIGNLACFTDTDAGFGDLVAGLRPKGWTPKAPAIDLVGSWTASSSSMMMMYTFDAAGHYLLGYGNTTYSTTGVREGQVRVTTTTHAPMSGTYTLRNGELTMDGRTLKVRVFEERQPDGSWKPGIALRGADGEAQYRRVAR